MAGSVEDIKELRRRTGAGMMDCKKALDECETIEKAVDYLREKGLVKAAKKASREALEGNVFSYIHTNKKIGVLLELNCETDFVAKTEEFQKLGHEICMQIAAANPLYILPEDVPAEELEKEKEVFKNQALDEGKPANIVDKIAEGRINKYYEETCLMEQCYIRDSSIKIKDMVIENIAKMGENIIINRFSRFSIGG